MDAAWHERRRLGIGGSDANIIMRGDPDRIMRLWREKRGELQPENLDDVLAVRMGQATEALNITWFERKTGMVVSAMQQEMTSADYPFMRATLDGLVDPWAVFEAKFHAGDKSLDDLVAFYAPQLHHNALVADRPKAMLSVIFGRGARFSYGEIECDPFYTDELIRRETEFWRCVQTGDPPVAQEPAAPPESITRVVDMTGNNLWSAMAADFMATRSAHETHERAIKELKQMVPSDAKLATGHGIIAKRDGRGLSIKEA